MHTTFYTRFKCVHVYSGLTAQNIPHSPMAIAACQYTASFFVDQTRLSKHVYPTDMLMDDVIWNFSPIFTQKGGKSNFTQVYAWNF